MQLQWSGRICNCHNAAVGVLLQLRYDFKNKSQIKIFHIVVNSEVVVSLRSLIATSDIHWIETICTFHSF